MGLDMSTGAVILCALGLLACYTQGHSIDTIRSKRQTADLTPGNWASCREGDAAPPTRVNTTSRIQALRKTFEEDFINISAYIIPSEDAHQSEYPSDHDRRREYISGFSGTAGMAVVTRDKAALWTDGRYYLQAEEQLDCNWILMRSQDKDVPQVTEWLNMEFTEGGRVGANAFLISDPRWKAYQKALEANITLVPVELDLVDWIWKENRPPPPDTVINALPLKFAGQSWQDKLDDTLTTMAEKKMDLMVVTGLDEIAWLFNMRATDVTYNPFFLSYAIIDRAADEVVLFLWNHRQKLTQNASDPETTQKVYEHLNTNTNGQCTGKTGRCVMVLKYNPEFLLNEVGRIARRGDVSKIWVSFACNHAIVRMIPEDKLHVENTPLATTKMAKNPVEVQGMRQSHIRDAVAVISCLAKLEASVQKGDNWTEVSAAEDLKKFRGDQKYNRGLSFATISSSGPNGAIVHYIPTDLTDAAITTDQMYLLDSGGQYLDGTTDVTRTLHFGKPTKYEKECYTRVLMGQIDFFHAIWPKGLYGRELDSFARAPLWNVGLMYRHGTGHGIGMYLSVHEGPGRISLSHSSFIADHALAENQFFSDEPGFYEDGEFGIRLENILMIKPANTTYHFEGADFLTWDHVTLVPYEPNLIDTSLLSQKQIEYLNDYNEKVRTIIGPELEQQGQTAGYKWMVSKTNPVPYTGSASILMCPAFIPILILAVVTCL